MPPTPDDPITTAIDAADSHGKLSLLLEAQRQTGLIVERAIEAQIRREESTARLMHGLATLIELPPKLMQDKWGAPVVLLLVITFSVVVLTGVGIDVDVNRLANTAAYAWQGEPSCPTGGAIRDPEEVP